MPDAERLREVLDYDPETGVFAWKQREGARKGWNTRFAGTRAGCLSQGYVAVKIDGVLYLAHRLAWLYVHGEWPLQIDHIDTNRANNRFANLRLADTSQNGANRGPPRNNSSGFKGVTYCAGGKRRKRWQAAIKRGQRMFNLGRFATPEEAHAAYAKAAAEHFGEFARSA